MDFREKYETIVGLEVHVQLNTNSKAYCSDANLFGQPPNTCISPISMGYPGTLPKINKEVIERRYGNFLIKKKRLPDLLIIDGGPTHLNSVKDKLKELGINQLNVVSISKGVRRKAEYDLIHLIGHKPINLNKDDLSKLLIQEIRDETHRFAILRHRRKSMKRITKSHLDSLPGIGERRKTILLRYFGGIDQIRKASSEDIANVPGIGKSTSDLVYNYFH